MSTVNITPQAVLLTSGQAVTFSATDANNQPVSVSWSLNPQAGTLLIPPINNAAAPAAGSQAPSATYIAATVTAAQTIAVIASTTSQSASATITLTPDAIVIVPSKVDLKPGQIQIFEPVIAGAPPSPPAQAEPVKWILSPPVGALDQNGAYTAPAEVPDSATVNVIATSRSLGKQAVATINLCSPPWQGMGVNLLGFYLLLVFCLVFLMIGLWPPALPSLDSANAARVLAEKTLDDKTATLEKAETESSTADAVAAKLQADSSKPAPAAAATPAKPDASAPTLEAAKATAKSKAEVLRRATESHDFATKDLDKKRELEDKTNNPFVDTKLDHHINRELDYLWLVLLAGSLGSFLHMGQSYTDFIGNRTIKSSWAWWYGFHPFIGAGLALVFYAAVRGGLMAVATGSNSTAADLNPFGLVAMGALVGMFSKAATTKLGEVFDTLFKSDKQNKDKLDPSTQSPKPTTGAAGSSATATSTTTK